MVCPHAAIRMKVYPADAVDGAPAAFQHKEFKSRDLVDHRITIQVAPDDCTGCGVCVDVCPAKSKTEVRHKAINMEPAAEHRDAERPNWEFFQSIAPLDRNLIAHDTVKGAQALEPLFEFSLACAGCGETPYLKLVSQLFGDRMIVANATGCSSIYGANLPTTPWTVNAEGRGPAWNNSLFEDNAEFGLGMRLALDAQTDQARRLLELLAPQVGEDLVREILDADQAGEAGIAAQRDRVDRLTGILRGLDGSPESDASHLLSLAGDLVRKGIWIVGGDGWAYDIGYGGLDHVLGSGRNVNILVLDTEVYSNTGGQASKATPRGAVAKFAAAGKPRAKKDLGAVARAYGNVYVAQVSMGGNDAQTAKALLEADAWPGTSLVIAYSTCIAHGIDMEKSMSHQKDAVKSGYWPLYRFHPSEVEDGQPFKLDSGKPSIPVERLRRGRDPLRGPRPHPSGAGDGARASSPRRTSTSAGATTSSCRRCAAACPTSSTDRGRCRPATGPASRPRRGTRRDRRSPHHLPRPRAALAARRLGLAPDRRARLGARPRRGGRRGDRPPLALRGGDPPRGDRAQPVARGRVRGVRRGARLLPGHRGGRLRRRPLPRAPRVVSRRPPACR